MATILVIDDSESQRSGLRKALGDAGFEVLLAADGIEGLKQLLQEHVDLVICDLEMPGLDGGKLIPMSDSPEHRAIPFLMLTAVQDPKRRARLFKEGARDVITKPYHHEELLARVRYQLELERLRHELLAKNEQLERLSTTDELTGLYNRRHIDSLLRLEFQRARRHGTPLAAVMLDLDHFKQVNDVYGHQAGDQVLREVGGILASRLRSTDSGGRYGGEEFLLLVGCVAKGARTLAERWRMDLESRDIALEGGRSVALTMSVGVAPFNREMGGPAQLVAAADAALYQAKEAGRNQVVMAGALEKAAAK